MRELRTGVGQLVLSGAKTTTAGLVWEHAYFGWQMPAVGNKIVILDGERLPRCAIETTARFRKAIRGREAEILRTLRFVQEGFGKPHLHIGLGIRKLAEDLFECRTDLKLRLVFLARRGTLTFDYAGDHDDVRKYLKER